MTNMHTRKMTTRDWAYPTLFVAVTVATAFLLHGCATFSAARADIPGTVRVGLDVAACVTAAVKDNTDELLREKAIGACVTAAFNELTPEAKSQLVAP
jgi:hypothetical protein